MSADATCLDSEKMVVVDRACQIYGMTIAIFSEDLTEETSELQVETDPLFRLCKKIIHIPGNGKDLLYRKPYCKVCFSI